MPTDLNCPGCKMLLRVPDDSAGKMVRCPGCEIEFQVPVPEQTSGPEQTFGPRQASGSPQEPGPTRPKTLPEIPQAHENPFASPQFGQTPPGNPAISQQPVRVVDEGRIRSLVVAPAIFLMIVGVIGLGGSILTLIVALVPGGNGQMFAEEDLAVNSFLGVVCLIGFVRSSLLIFGGYRMMRLRSYHLAMIASIAAIVPTSLCASFCCFLIFLEMPAGVWSTIILCQSDVRSAFDRPPSFDDSF